MDDIQTMLTAALHEAGALRERNEQLLAALAEIEKRDTYSENGGCSGPFAAIARDAIAKNSVPIPASPGGFVQIERVFMQTWASSVAIDNAPDQGFVEHLKSRTARAAFEEILREGFFEFRLEPEADAPMTRITASLAVVHPTRLQSKKERNAQVAYAFGVEVAHEAVGNLINWNSQNTGPDGAISKRQAPDAVMSALVTVRDRELKATEASVAVDEGGKRCGE